MHALKKLFRSFGFAFAGWKIAFRTQLNFRIQTILAVLAFVMGAFFGLSTGEWLWLLVSVALVLAAELFNSAIEALVDFVSPGYHEKAGKIKDMAAGAVTVVAIYAAISGLLIFTPKIIIWLSTF